MNRSPARPSIRLTFLFAICLALPLAAQELESRDGGASETATLSLTPTGIHRHVAGKWASVAVVAKNPTDSERTEIATVHLRDDRDLQFSRQLWVPPRAKRRAPLPVLIPDNLFGSEAQIQATMTHLLGDRLQSNSLGMSQSKRSLMLSWERARTAFLLDAISPEGEGGDPVVLEQLDQLVRAGRKSTAFDRQDLGAVRLDATLFSGASVTWDGLDQIVIASDRILDDSATLENLRLWLRDGGRVWLMLNHLNANTVEQFLGDAAPLTVIDRVDLNEFDLGGQAWSSEVPVELMRVIPSTDDVHATVNGWPAACWYKVGSGEVLVTALDGRGWMTEEGLTDSYRELAERFFVSRAEPRINTAVMLPMLDDEIGYEIPPSSFASAVLGTYVSGLVLAGVYWMRRKALHRMALFLPLAALLASGVFWWAGRRSTDAVPSTIAVGSVVRYWPEYAAARVDSLSAVYSQSAGAKYPTATRQTLSTLHRREVEHEYRQVRWQDDGASSWSLDLPPGAIRHVDSSTDLALAEPGIVIGRLDRTGFRGRLTGVPRETRDDAIIVARGAPAMTVQMRPQGDAADVTGGPGDLLMPDQYVSGTFISDTQQTRQEVLRALMKGEESAIGWEPSLIFWSEPSDGGLVWPDHYRHLGATLTVVPIRLQRPESGTVFHLPPTFVRLDTVSGEQGITSIYNPRTGQWIERLTKEAEVELRAAIPKTLLPCRLNRVSVEIQITAPLRTLEIRGRVDDQTVTLFRRDNPSGVIEFDVPPGDAMSVDAEGGIRFTVAVSETVDQAAAAAEGIKSSRTDPSESAWRIPLLPGQCRGGDAMRRGSWFGVSVRFLSVLFCASASLHAENPFAKYPLEIYREPPVEISRPRVRFHPRMLQIWLTAVDRPDEETRRSAIDTIVIAKRRGMEGLEQAVPKLAEVAAGESESPLVVRAAANALIRLDARDHAELLAGLVQRHGESLSSLIEPALARWESAALRDRWVSRVQQAAVDRSSTSGVQRVELVYAIDGLGAIGEASVAEQLEPILNDPLREPSVRLAAARALGQLRDSGLVELAASFITDQPAGAGPDVSGLIALALLPRHRDETSIELLNRLADGSGPTVRAGALRRLLQIDAGQLEPRLDDLVTDGDANVRRLSVEAMFTMKRRRHLDRLAGRLDDVHPTLRADVADGLVSLAEDQEMRGDITHAVMKVLDRNDWRGCEQAADVLVRLDHKPAGSRLVELLEHDRDEVRIVSAWGLRKLNLPRLLPDMLDHAGAAYERGDDHEYVAQLFVAFGQQGYEPAEALMREYIPRRFQLGVHTRGAATWAVGKLHVGDPEPALVKLMLERLNDVKTSTTETEEVRQMCAVSFVRMEAYEAIRHLRKYAIAVRGDIISRTCFWAVEQMTGETPPPVPEKPVDYGDWFLSPLP